MIPPFENDRGYGSDDGDGISPMRKFASIAVVVVGVLVVGGLLGWAGGRMLVKPQAPATPAQTDIVQATPPAPVRLPPQAPGNYQTQTLLGLPSVEIPGQKSGAPAPSLTDTLGNGNPSAPAPNQVARSTDNTPSYGPSSSSGIVLIGPSDKPSPILPPMQHSPPPLNNATPEPVHPPTQLGLAKPLATPSHGTESLQLTNAPPAKPAVKPAPIKVEHSKPVETRHAPMKQIAAKPVQAKPAKVKPEPHKRVAKAVAHEPRRPAKASVAASSGPWIVQLGVYREGINAQDMISRLSHKGETAHTAQRHGLQVVYLPGGNQAEAVAMARKLKAKGFDTYVMKGP